MPSYNGESWISEAIESVLAQTLGGFELVVVDDGSTDATLEILARYAARDQRIRVTRKNHTDVSDSLNVGMRAAEGAWIARLDQDDICEPTRLERQYGFAVAHPGTVFVGSAYTRVNEDGYFVAVHGFPTSHDGLMRNLVRLRGFCAHSAAFFRRDVALEVGGYRSTLNQANDHDLWLRMSSRGRFASLPEPLVRCRGHERQMSHEGDGEPQLVESVAGSVCHFIRLRGGKDPLDPADSSRAEEFLHFVRDALRQVRMSERRLAWKTARAGYFGRSNRIFGLAAFLFRLLRSRYAFSLVRDKLLGFTLPRRIASDWMQSVAANAA